MDSLYKVDDEVQKVSYGKNGFNLSDGIGNYLNDTVYNALFDEAEKTAMATLSLYNAPYHYGADPMKTSLTATGTRITAKVGLNSVGSILSGSSVTAKQKGVTGWLMNYNDTYPESDQRVYHASDVGTSAFGPVTNIRGVKPVIALKGNVTIASGNGTSTSPYQLSY